MSATYTVRVTKVEEAPKAHSGAAPTLCVEMRGDDLALAVVVPADDHPRIGDCCEVAITPLP